MTSARMTRRALLCGAALAAAPAWAAASRAPVFEREALPVARPTQAVMVALARAGRRLVAGGERGLIVFSDDGGRQWTQASVPSSVTLTALRFANEREGWAAGNMGVVLRTQDGGATWRRVLDGRAAAALAFKAAQSAADGGALEEATRLAEEGADKPFTDLAIRSDGSLLAVGAYGMAFASLDGGASWQSQMHRLPNPDGLSLYGLASRGGEQWLYGEQGLLLRADDAQSPFAGVESPSTGSLFGSVALHGGALLLYGLRGKVFRSAAAGEPWAAQQTPVDASLCAGLQLDDGRVLLAGAAGQLLESRDEGRSFRPLALKTRYPFSAIAQAPDGALVLAGARGLVRVERAELQPAAGPSTAKGNAI